MAAFDLQFYCKGHTDLKVNEKRYFIMRIKVYGRGDLHSRSRRTTYYHGWNTGKTRGISPFSIINGNGATLFWGYTVPYLRYFLTWPAHLRRPSFCRTGDLSMRSESPFSWFIVCYPRKVPHACRWQKRLACGRNKQLEELDMIGGSKYRKKRGEGKVNAENTLCRMQTYMQGMCSGGQHFPQIIGALELCI